MIPYSNKLSDYLHYFLTRYLPQHQEVSPQTLATYKQAFIHLLRYYKRRFPEDPDPDLGQFEVPLLLDFLSYLEKDLGNCPSTRNTRLAAVKSFFRMVALLDPRYHRLCRQIRMIPMKRAPRWPLDSLDKKEVDTLFSCVDTGRREGFRDLCILRILYNTGARASEVCALHLSDLHLAEKQLWLYGKGSKVRTLPLWNSTVALLRTYLKSERRVPRSRYEDFLFINQRGTALTRSGLYSLCQRYLSQAAQQLPTLQHKKIHPVHGWRYTTATHLLLAGVDVTVIQEWLGHASIDTTCRYKGVSIEAKREALDKFYLFETSCHPLNSQPVDWGLYPDLLAFLESL
ncbi:site-specific integrase [Acidobacteria bacterium AH-259-D05]|nr:site-specific integrase [Acidobacteria bacterium AH-259-D05]